MSGQEAKPKNTKSHFPLKLASVKGLSFSKRIMTVYHKGDIRVENSKNGKGGTTFELKLPIG